MSLFPSGEKDKWGQSKSYDDERPIYYNREKLYGETNQLKECLLCKNTIASGFNQLKYIPFLYLNLNVELPLVRSFSDRNIYLKVYQQRNATPFEGESEFPIYHAILIICKYKTYRPFGIKPIYETVIFRCMLCIKLFPNGEKAINFAISSLFKNCLQQQKTKEGKIN